MRVGIAADHGGYALKEQIALQLRLAGHDVWDFGASCLQLQDDYPDYVIPMAEAVAQGLVQRGIAVCGSGVGACIAANKVPGVRAAVIHESFSARQGVEDDDMNVLCVGGRVLGENLAWQLIQMFLQAEYSQAERHQRRLAKIAALEQAGMVPTPRVGSR